MLARKNPSTALILVWMLVLALGSCKSKPATMVEVLKNKEFSLWSQGTDKAPDSWAFGGEGKGTVSKETSVVKAGNEAVKIAHTSGGIIALYQEIDNVAGSKGKNYVFTCWVNSKDANSAHLALADGASWQYSANYSAAGQWEYLTLKGKVSNSASQIRAHLYVNNKATVYFSGASFKIEQ